MKKLLVALVITVVCHPVCAADETSYNENLVDLAAGPQVRKLAVSTGESRIDSTYLHTIREANNERANFLYVLLHPDYQAKLVPSKRGVIYQHKQSNMMIVVARTKFTGEEKFIWSILITAKKPTASGVQLRHYTIADYDNKHFRQLLSSVVP